MAPATDWLVRGHDLYAILDVPHDSSPAALKRAYRMMARRHHPDTNAGCPRAEQRFKEICAAYAVLSDQRSRARYDLTHRRTRPAWTPPAPRRREHTDGYPWAASEEPATPPADPPGPEASGTPGTDTPGREAPHTETPHSEAPHTEAPHSEATHTASGAGRASSGSPFAEWAAMFWAPGLWAMTAWASAVATPTDGQ